MTRPGLRLQQHFKGVLWVLVTVVVLGPTPLRVDGVAEMRNTRVEDCR